MTFTPVLSLSSISISCNYARVISYYRAGQHFLEMLKYPVLKKRTSGEETIFEL